MESIQQNVVPVEGYPPDADHRDIKLQLARVLSSDLFVKSPQLSRFLRHCVEQTLTGHQDNLKEQLLGTDVFRRNPFDPRLDPIVRVEARRLRAKLDDYYASHGASDPIIISFQRGDYIPRFIHVDPSTDKRAKSEKQASILIVEDERLVAKDLENRLRAMGYAVLGSAASGETALEAVETLHPDIVLMDIVLAGAMRGTEAARHIWSRWRIPVVYLTAFSDAVVLEDIKGSEPYGYILKPFEPKQVHAVLQLALSRHAKVVAESTVRTDGRNHALSSVLENSRISTWEWTVKDETLSWPASVECPAQPILSTVDSTPEEFLDAVLAADRDHVINVFTEAIRNRGRIEVAYRKAAQVSDPAGAIAIGVVTEDSSGALRCSGLEIGANSASPAGERSDDAKDIEQFILAAGHDLQEPLRTIKAYTQLLARQGKDIDSASGSVLSRIEGGVDQMHALVSDLLSYTMLSRQEPTPSEHVSLDEPLDVALESLRRSITESGAEVTRAPLPSVMANKVQIIQLFQNLIANAIKYRKEGVPPVIRISARNASGHWRVSVDDNGIGFDPVNGEYIFEPFKRLQDRAIPGTGLGLAICRRIVEAHGGRIWAESQLGVGSCFHFTLPAVPGGSRTT
jgi:signal transduction histidine kinase/DNA-binding NarL/FixJ family response regulator